MNIKELKKHLQNILQKLEEIPEDAEVDAASNTYFLNKKYDCDNMLMIRDVGFINLDFPTEEDDEEDF